jgi:hypothetical protein
MRRAEVMMRASLVLFLMPLASGCDHAPKELYRDHPMGLAAGALRDTAFTWETRQTDHFRIHFQLGSYAAYHIDQFVEDAEQARANGLRLLSEKDFRPRIDVFHLSSREQMKRLTDYPVRGWTDPASRTVLLVRSSGANQGERHEIAHVLSHNLWGHSLDAFTTGWMSEALATYAGGPCSGYSIDEIAAHLNSRDELIPLDSLARNFRSYNDLVAYLQAGSFFGYVLENYGVSGVRALWEEGFEAFERIDWAPLKKEGCR